MSEVLVNGKVKVSEELGGILVKAMRSKYTFGYKGIMHVDNLWDLKPDELDGIYRELNDKLEYTKGKSLMQVKTAIDSELENKLKIVQFVFDVKMAEADERKNAEANKQERNRILELIARKKQSEQENLSVKELEEMLDKLN